MRAIYNARIHDSPLVNAANPVFLELLIQLLKELVHNPQACQFSAKATDGAVPELEGPYPRGGIR